jgi:tetratricopeptide (TPR) repeat protein
LPAFVKGFPAVLFLGGFIGAVIVASFLLETRRVGQYEGRYALELTQRDDPQMAAEYAQKLMGLLPEEDRYRYHLGLARFQAGDSLGAMDVMKFIAEKRNNPLAQVWLAKTVAVDDSFEMDVEERAAQSIQYYTSAIENLDPEEDLKDYTEAHLGLALAYESQSLAAPDEDARQASLKKAITNLKVITDGQIMFFGQLKAIPRLISHYVETNQKEAAKAQLRTAMTSISPIARRFPDNLEIWNVMVTSCALVDDFDYADSVIKEGLQLASTPTSRFRIMQLQSKVLLKKAEFIQDVSTEENYKLRLKAISRAVLSDPISPEGFQELARYVVPENESPEQAIWLRESVIGSKSPSITHIILGLRALNRGEILEGQRHWQIASQQSTQSYRVINSLISYCDAKESEKFNNLTDVVSVAIESFPSQFVFYITRGRMHLKQKKYQQAVDDLEIAARKLPNEIILRESLALAYDGVGNKAKADENQAEAQRLKMALEERRMELIEGKK